MNNYSQCETENFLDAAFGNFLDCIKNLIYSLQKYLNVFYNDTNLIYVNYDRVKDKNIRSVLKFSVMESEEITKMKAIKFGVDVESLLYKKYESLLSNIRNDKEDNKYRISSEAYIYLDSYQSNIDWQKICLNPYIKKTKEHESIYDFISYMNNDFKTYGKINFTHNDREFSKDEVITILEGSFMKLSVTILQLKRMIENSNSMYTSALVCRQLITLIIITYYVVSTIQFVEK